MVILAIFLTIAVIVALTWAAISYTYSNNGGTGATLPPCSQEANPGSLIDIPGTGADCIQNGVPTSLRYIGDLGSMEYDYVVAPWGTHPLDVCIGFCTGYTGGVCSGPVVAGKTAQENFDLCMSQLSSTTCTPPLPIAASGTTLYYAFSPTCRICDGCQ